MRTGLGRVSEIRRDAGGNVAARIICPVSLIPRAGQYLLARATEDKTQVLSEAVFPSELFNDGFLSAPGIPESWHPGVRLALRGPLGRGFSLDKSIRHLMLVALGESTSRLLPLMDYALTQKAAAVLFTYCPLPTLPASVEAYPLVALSEALPWAEMVALDVPFGQLSGLSELLSIPDWSLCPAQVLVTTEMPCGGVAECGACAVPVRRGWKLACKDGPVFDLGDLDLR